LGGDDPSDAFSALVGRDEGAKHCEKRKINHSVSSIPNSTPASSRPTCVHRILPNAGIFEVNVT
jgi:hypothetical protein